jgi:hypothetical protein
MQFHLRQVLAAGEFVIVDDVIAFLITGPIGVVGCFAVSCASAGSAAASKTVTINARTDIRLPPRSFGKPILSTILERRQPHCGNRARCQNTFAKKVRDRGLIRVGNLDHSEFASQRRLGVSGCSSDPVAAAGAPKPAIIHDTMSGISHHCRPHGGAPARKPCTLPPNATMAQDSSGQSGCPAPTPCVVGVPAKRVASA